MKQLSTSVIFAVGMAASVSGWSRPASSTPAPIWIDTDISAGVPLRDVDDGYALVHALRNYQSRVAAISVSTGNIKNLKKMSQIAHHILKLTGSEGIPVYSGASSPEDLDTEASRALAEYLKQLDPGTPVKILVLCSMTNVHGALLLYPEGVTKISEILFVGGRRLESEPEVGSRHWVLTDSNYWHDEAGFEAVLKTGVPLTLLPTDLAVQFQVNGTDLDRLEYGTRAAQWLARKSRLWKFLFKVGPGVDGFFPFDLMASSYITDRNSILCDEKMPIKILLLPNRSFRQKGKAFRNRPVVSREFRDAKDFVRYCHTLAPGYHEKLMGELEN